eukprot:scaffold14854_cov129-Isochrysis_galbana.AAC.7
MLGASSSIGGIRSSWFWRCACPLAAHPVPHGCVPCLTVSKHKHTLHAMDAAEQSKRRQVEPAAHTQPHLRLDRVHIPGHGAVLQLNLVAQGRSAHDWAAGRRLCADPVARHSLRPLRKDGTPHCRNQRRLGPNRKPRCARVGARTQQGRTPAAGLRRGKVGLVLAERRGNLKAAGFELAQGEHAPRHSALVRPTGRTCVTGFFEQHQVNLASLPAVGVGPYSPSYPTDTRMPPPPPA